RLSAMIPRISVVPKISIRKKPLAISGMITRMAATAQAAGLSNAGQALMGVLIAGLSAAVAGGLAGSLARSVNAISSPRQQALRPQRQHQHHDEEGHDDRIGRDVDGAELLGEADDQRPQRRTRDRAHAADNDDDKRGKQEARVLARRDRLKR